jgi:O-antigen/teichoic acid export membrane protein
MTPGGGARRALLLSAAHRYSVLLLRFLMLVVLARLLTPREYGVFASAAAIIAAGTVIADLGVKQYLITDATPGLAGRRAALGLGMIAAILVALATDGLVPLLVSSAPADAVLRLCVLILSATFLILPLNSVATAVLMRELRFGALYLSGMVGTFVLAVTGIFLAAHGFGALSLAWAGVAEALAGTAMLCALVPPPLPGIAGWRGLLEFGRTWIPAQGAPRVGETVSRLIVSGVLGFGALGVLSRAQGVVQLFDRALTDAVKPVILPALSERRRAGYELASVFRRQVICLAAVAWPFFGVMALLLAKPLVQLLLGSQWLAAVPAVRLLALGGLFLPLSTGALTYFTAVGAVGRWVPIAWGVQAARLVLVFAGALVSLPAACAGLAASVALEALLAERLLRARLGYRGGDLLRDLAHNIAPTAACLAGATVAVLALRAHAAGPAVLLSVAVLAGGLPWLALVLGSRHPLRRELAALRLDRARIKALLARRLYPFRHALGRFGEAAALRLLNRRHKWHIAPELTVAQFFAALEARGISYLVLRWFENLPQIEPGHDIDLLVVDDHVRLLRPLLTRWPVGQPCDVYSTTGMPDFAFRPWFPGTDPSDSLAPFPPWQAERMLARARVVESKAEARLPPVARGDLREGHRRWSPFVRFGPGSIPKGDGGATSPGLAPQSPGIAVPDPEDHFFSLAYHAIYLKGAWSGLPSASAPEEASPAVSHDYAAVLRRLAEPLGIALPRPLTLEALDAVLAAAGWRPPFDMLEKLARWHPWIARALAATATKNESEPGVTVFFVRQRAVAAGLAPRVAALVEAKGFEILETADLVGEHQAALARAVRGGNWGGGPWQVGGGPPGVALIALDTLPMPPSAAERRRFPNLDNARVLQTKTTIRALINARLPAELRYNALHATDNSPEAWDVVRLLVPELEARLRATIDARRGRFTTREPVLAELSRFANRAKVELIRYDDGSAVKKTFRAHATRFLERELAFYRRFAAELPELPRVLEAGSNYFITPFHANRYGRRRLLGFHPPRLMKLCHVRQLAALLRHVMAAGYDPIDLTPANNTLITAEGMKVIDFEYAWYAGAPVRPETSFCLTGVPDRFEGDLPPYVAYLRDPYPTEWFPCIGLGLESFLHDPPWRQAIKRAANYPRLLAGWAFGGAVRRKGRRLASLRHANGAPPKAGAHAPERLAG